MKTIKINKTFETIEEINQSKELKEVYEGFHFEKIANYDSSKFIEGYATDDGVYYIRVMTKGKEAGLRFLQKVETFGCLSNQDFQLGRINEDKIEIREDISIPCDQENRNMYSEIFRKNPSTAFLTRA